MLPIRFVTFRQSLFRGQNIGKTRFSFLGFLGGFGIGTLKSPPCVVADAWQGFFLKKNHPLGLCHGGVRTSANLQKTLKTSKTLNVFKIY